MTSPTPSDGRAMSDEQLRIAVAEAMGWTDIAVNPFAPNPPLCGFHNATGKTPASNGGSKWGIPNFPASLDACASFEATLTKEQRFPYRRSLCQQVGGCSTNLKSFEQITSTARQRCLAYLATVAPAKLK